MQLRHDQRIPVYLRISLSDLDEIGEVGGTVLDLSPRGCKVQSILTVCTGEFFLLQLHIPGEDVAIQIEEAAVRWALEPFFGLEFITILPSHLDRLRQFLHHLRQSSSL